VTLPVMPDALKGDALALAASSGSLLVVVVEVAHHPDAIARLGIPQISSCAPRGVGPEGW